MDDYSTINNNDSSPEKGNVAEAHMREFIAYIEAEQIDPATFMSYSGDTIPPYPNSNLGFDMGATWNAEHEEGQTAWVNGMAPLPCQEYPNSLPVAQQHVAQLQPYQNNPTQASQSHVQVTGLQPSPVAGFSQCTNSVPATAPYWPEPPTVTFNQSTPAIPSQASSLNPYNLPFFPVYNNGQPFSHSTMLSQPSPEAITSTHPLQPSLLFEPHYSVDNDPSSQHGMEAAALPFNLDMDMNTDMSMNMNTDMNLNHAMSNNTNTGMSRAIGSTIDTHINTAESMPADSRSQTWDQIIQGVTMTPAQMPSQRDYAMQYPMQYPPYTTTGANSYTHQLPSQVSQRHSGAAGFGQNQQHFHQNECLNDVIYTDAQGRPHQPHLPNAASQPSRAAALGQRDLPTFDPTSATLVRPEVPSSSSQTQPIPLGLKHAAKTTISSRKAKQTRGKWEMLNNNALMCLMWWPQQLASICGRKRCWQRAQTMTEGEIRSAVLARASKPCDKEKLRRALYKRKIKAEQGLPIVLRPSPKGASKSEIATNGPARCRQNEVDIAALDGQVTLTPEEEDELCEMVASLGRVCDCLLCPQFR